MITSNLPSNNLFDPTSISVRGYLGRTTSNKSHGTTDLPFSQSSFGHNIWQSNWQPSVEKISNHVANQNGNRRPQPPSLALPNIKGNAHLFGSNSDRKSPIGSERGMIRDSEPHSARSRSQHESATLTPTSLSSDSELSVQPGISAQEHMRQLASNIDAGENRKRTDIWPNAPEFRPALTLPSHNSFYGDPFEQSRNPFGGAHKLKSPSYPDYGLGTIWDFGNKDSYFSEQDDYRPILPSGTDNGSPSEYELDLRATKTDLQNLNISFDRLAVDGERRRNGCTTSDTRASVTGKPRILQQSVQDRQQPYRYFSDTWTEKAPIQIQNHRAVDLGSSLPVFEATQISATRRIDSISSTRPAISQNNSLSSYLQGVSQSSNARYRGQINELRPTEAQPYHYRIHGNGFYDSEPAPSGVTGYRNLNYNLEPSLGDPYMLYNPIAHPQPESAQITRSPLLEEFRIHGKTKKYELKDIFGHIVEFSGDQLGSRFIQHKLEVANSEEKDRVFNEIACDSRQLMTDLFGNYVIQKLFEHGNQSQKKVLASHMKGHIMALSTQQYGCRVVQKALEHILTDQQASLIKEIDGFVLKIVDNQHGNHVIQKAIECVSGEHIQFLVDAHRGHVHSLSKHAYGCRVIQRMLEHCQPRAKRAILDELHMNIGDLIQDPFGNYVVQHVIVNGEAQDRKPVIDKVQGKLLENAMHKFASNVVEKALDYATDDQRHGMLRILTGRDENGQSQILKLLSHQYGNYVIQKSAAHLNGHALHALLEEMEQYLMQLRRVSTGKQISALETSVKDARQRLHHQQRQNLILNTPTEPTRHNLVRRGI